MAITTSKQFCNRGHDTAIVGRYNSGTCKICMLENGKYWRKANPERQRANAAIWQSANLQRYRVGRKIRNWRRRGIVLTREEHDSMFVKQNGQCAICRVDASTLPRAMCADHDHVTGKVRGLLCYKCNSGLGFFQDNIKLLKVAVNYLG